MDKKESLKRAYKRLRKELISQWAELTDTDSLLFVVRIVEKKRNVKDKLSV